MSDSNQCTPSLSSAANEADPIEAIWKSTNLPGHVQVALARVERRVSAATGIANLLRTDALLSERLDESQEAYVPLGGFVVDQLQTAVIELCWTAWEQLESIRDCRASQGFGSVRPR